MKTETQELIRFKTTQKMCMDYIPSTGSVLITIEGDKKEIVTPMYVIEITKRQCYPLLRGIVTWSQRFYRKNDKKTKKNNGK